MSSHRRSWLRQGTFAIWLGLGLGVGAASVRPAFAQQDDDSLREDERIQVQADSLEYDRESGWIEAVGNVVIRKGGQELRADYVRVNANTQKARAVRNVVLSRDGQVWRGEELEYDFQQREGMAAGLSAQAEPFRILADRVEKTAEHTYVFHRALLTTCECAPPNCPYHVSAKKVTLVEHESVTARGAVWHFGGVPVMYIPYWRKRLDEDLGFGFAVGQSSRMGMFLLTDYTYRLHPEIKGVTRLDYRTRRGVAVGQDFLWNRSGAWNGKVQAYLLDDNRPEYEIDSSQRYRLKLDHHHTFSDRDYTYAQVEYVSDRYLREEFFGGEYRNQRQPDNYITYMHRGDQYTAGILLHSRVNDFYSSVNRMPELSLDVLRQSLAQSRFYYESATDLSFLEAVWEKDAGLDDTSAVRLDSRHAVYHPDKYFGFLNVIPRVAYRGTYYSDSLTQRVTYTTTEQMETNVVTLADGTSSNAVTPVLSRTAESETVDAGAVLRNVFELGVESSFKAYKIWGDEENRRRHVVEPYVNYTLIPEPNVLPEELYQFDAVDGLRDAHWMKLGVRNKLQVKRGERPFDLIDLDSYTIYNLDPADGRDAIERVYFDTVLRIWEGIRIEADSQYSVQESEFDIFNVWMTATRGDWRTWLEYRYRQDDSRLLLADITFSPVLTWDFNGYARYEFEDSRLEEIGGYVQRNYDCMSVRLGLNMVPGYTRADGSDVDEDWRILLEFWLTHFPEVRLRSRHRG